MDCALRYILALSLVILTGRLVPGLYDLLVSIVTLGTTFYISSYAVLLLRHWIPTKRLYPGNKAVFITGCDSGFGHETAKRLDKIGFKVFAGCLKPSEEGAVKLQKLCSDKLEIIPLDVTCDDSVASALQVVKDSLQGKELWGLVNNAGISPVGEVEFSPLSTFKEAYEINSLGVVRVSQAFLPLLRRSKGRVVTLASIIGRFTMLGVVPYCMSKYATISFCEGLRLEMKKWGVKVISIEPWVYRTNLTSMNTLGKFMDKGWDASPEIVKEDYGTRYKDELKAALAKFSIAANPNLNEVVECIEDALLEEFPHRYYRPADPAFKALYWISQFLPECTKEYLLLYNSPKSKPDMLLK